MNENKINRADDYARHGGDIKGISNNIDYIKDMGFTAIWTNPFNENDMFKSSYHGYSITDHYKVDPRFGTMNELIDFSKKLNDKNLFRPFLNCFFIHSYIILISCFNC